MQPLRRIPQLTARLPYICHNCLLFRPSPGPRPYSTTKAPPPPPPPTSAYARLPSRRLVSLSGPDSTHFLQGVITTNIKPPAERNGKGFYAAFLNAQGRLLNDVFVYPDFGRGRGDEVWLIEADAKEVERLARHVKRYKLRAKFEVRVLGEGELEVWSLWGNGGVGSKGVIECLDERAPGMGRRLLLEGGRRPEGDIEETTEDSYRVRRYLMGVPEGQDELVREAALPQESNVDWMGGIDYRKGCYVGQELTIRTHHTGVVRKRILPVVVYRVEDAMPDKLEYDPKKEFGVEDIPIETQIGRFEKRGRSAGRWLAGVGNIGLGLCRLETMTSIQVQGEGGSYKADDEFKLEWEVDGEGPKTVKVKAFVPEWHLNKL